MTTEMTAVVKSRLGEGSVAVSRWPIPSPGPTDVIVEVHAAGVCGTDLHLLEDGYPSRPPVVMGHEVAGVVIELGSEVDAAWLGARVACETHHQVCDCDLCRAGKRNLCDNKTSMGSFVDGGFAERVRVPARLLHRVPDAVDLSAAALSEPLACVAHLLLDPPLISAGDRVLVTGPGPMGILCAQVARSMGARVVLAGLPADAERLDAARVLGFETSDGAVEPGFDVVLECSGSGGGARVALEAVRKAGRYVSVGIHGRDVTVPLDLVLYKELTITSGFAATAESWRRAMRLLEAGLVDLGALVTSIEPLQNWASVIDRLRAGQGMKIVFDPRLKG
ncbi:MAG: zinc-dependent alcohol dehydrogenase [Pseudolysinimonas sp.]